MSTFLWLCTNAIECILVAHRRSLSKMKPQVVLPGSIRKQVEQLYTTDPSAFKDYGLLALRQRKKKRKQRKLIKNATQSKRIPPKSAEVIFVLAIQNVS